MARPFDFAGLALSIPLLVGLLSCDEGSDTTPTERNLGQSGKMGPPSGEAVVTALLNHNPIVSLMAYDAASLTTGVAVILTARATDPDRDELHFVWTTACPGAFQVSEAPRARFVPDSMETVNVCEFDVLVSDGKGGSVRGTLTVPTQRPVLNIAPQIGIVWQSTAVADMGEDVAFHVAAVDPEGSFVTWRWQTTGGELGSEENPASGESNTTWTSPPLAGSYTVTAVAADPLGATATYVFAVEVRDGQL